MLHIARPALAALALVGAACSVNPATGERQFLLTSQAQEVSMGRQYDQQIVAVMGLYEDQSLQGYLQELGTRIARTTENPDLPWTFRVVDDAVVNAFALPGGFIYITRGILAHMDNEAQLAAVLGHEIGHVTGRHSAAQASQQQLAQIGLAVGVVLRPELAPYADVAQAGLGLLFLRHSRDDERQADDLGLRYMQHVNFDPRQAPEVFTMLEQVTAAAGGGGTPEWLSTHPNPGSRRERLEAAIAAQPPRDYDAMATNRAAYLARLDGMVYGPDPREGYFREALFRHPVLRFQLRFPDGWTTANRRDVVMAVSPGEDAIMQLRLAGEPTPEAAADAFFAQQGMAAAAPTRTTVGGHAAVGAAFTATTESGSLSGEALFVAYGGNVYSLVGFAVTSVWNGVARSVGASLRSFATLTDPAALSAEPRRVSIVTLDASMNFRQFAERYAQPGESDLLMLLNRTHANARFAQGARLKTITAGRMP
ncbi:MAG: M48 family metalloprotease [Gemmatimonadales bacterium]